MSRCDIHTLPHTTVKGNSPQPVNLPNARARIPTNGGKNHAYLAEVHPEGFGVYNEEDDENEQDP